MDDSELVKCYGKNGLHCTENCRLKECCINVIREKQDVLAIYNGAKNKQLLYMDSLAPDAEEEDREGYIRQLEQMMREAKAMQTSEAETREGRAVRLMAYFYLESPKIFDLLMRKVFLGTKQADIARSRQISRQALSKSARQKALEFLEFRKPLHTEKMMQNWTFREVQVYKLCFLDGCTTRSAAKQLGVSAMSIQRTLQVLRGKLNKNVTKKKPKKNKTEKSRIFSSQ